MAEDAGGGQRGAVRDRVRATLDVAATRNRARGRRLGAAFAFAPRAGCVLEKGEGATTAYLFRRQVISRRFCRACGTDSGTRGAMPDGCAIVASHVNGLDGVDPRAIAAAGRHYDGRSV
jgi:hypothetical protein